MEQYGYVDREGHPLAAWGWGYGFRIGQHWMEYLLEFLNVLAGFDYALGEGLNRGSQQDSRRLKYTRFTRLGLRRFVFYDRREKARHPLDDRALALLRAALEKQGEPVVNGDHSPLDLAKELLHSLSAIEVKRSWAAKALFPAHHNLLFWEALRARASKRVPRAVREEADPHEIDENIVYNIRNYFARGGEIYYLILSAGTEQTPSLRDEIEARVKHLLQGHNHALGELASTIDHAWQALKEQAAPGDEEGTKTGTLGWMPDPQCPLYTVIAQDVATFLQTELDPLESLDLLAHLLGFHLTLYLYHRAHPDATAKRHADGTCLDVCRLNLLVDALEGAGGGVVRQVSAALFRAQEARITSKGEAYVRDKVHEWLKETLQKQGETVQPIADEAYSHFSLRALSARSRRPYERRVDQLITEHREGKRDFDSVIDGYVATLTDLLMNDFRKNFLGVHQKLAKGIRFVAPSRGPGARFVLGDNLLKALVLALLPPGESVTYDDFLARLYERYGIIVGPREAKASGLFERQRINAEYYDRNREALLDKLKYAGLAEEYSDATAMVSGGTREVAAQASGDGLIDE